MQVKENVINARRQRTWHHNTSISHNVTAAAVDQEVRQTDRRTDGQTDRKWKEKWCESLCWVSWLAVGVEWMISGPTGRVCCRSGTSLSAVTSREGLRRQSGRRVMINNSEPVSQSVSQSVSLCVCVCVSVTRSSSISSLCRPCYCSRTAKVAAACVRWPCRGTWPRRNSLSCASERNLGGLHTNTSRHHLKSINSNYIMTRVYKQQQLRRSTVNVTARIQTKLRSVSTS